MNEEWRAIEGYKGMYEISNLGNVRRLSFYITHVTKTGKLYNHLLPEQAKKPTQGDDGYWDICLYKNGKPKYFSIHRLVAQAFIPNPENKPTVNHIDGNKSNNVVTNLEWATFGEQMKHASGMGLLINTHPEISRANLAEWNRKNCIVLKDENSCILAVGWSNIEKYLSMSSTKIHNRLRDNKLNVDGVWYILSKGLD